MASIRERPRKDGGCTYAVLFIVDGRQSSLPFETRQAAEAFLGVITAVGVDRALEMYRINPVRRRAPSMAQVMTTKDWLDHYIEHLTGVDPGTVVKYKRYVANDIEPIIGAIPLASLTREDVAKWVQWLEEYGALKRNSTERGPASPKTIKNKHGFLSAALAAAVPKHIASNPAAVQRLPQGKAREVDEEMVFLTREQFATLLAAVPEYWRPLVEFLVASGCRWGEAAALKPADVDLKQGTVRIRRAWTYSSGGYRLVKPKGKSLRTINVPASTLAKLDLTGEWVFLNRDGGPVRAPSFRQWVWSPARKRAKLDPPPRIHDLRHTCASWLIAARVPLPVVQSHLGHESITTTIGTYTHIDRRSASEAAEVIGALLNW